MGFNTVGDTSYSGIDNRIVNQIHVDGTNVKVMPTGTPPSVVYRIGDGTIHPEGWDNIDGEEYLDFYLSNAVIDNPEEVLIIGQNIDAVITVSDNIIDVSTVATNIANVNIVAGIDSDITAVALNNADISTVASSVANINTVAGIDTDVTTVSTNNANVTTVATNIADINTVATDIVDVNTIASNMTDVTYFADIYQGAKAVTPTLRNDGSALATGDLYFNTVGNAMFVYDGSAWGETGSAVNGVEKSEEFIATGGQTLFTIASGYDVGFVNVFREGMLLGESEYTADNGSTIALNVACTAGDIVMVQAFGAFSLADHYTKAEQDAIDTAQDVVIATKAPQATTYTKTEVDTEITNRSFGFKNHIINGGFDVWQRGNGDFASGAQNCTADRWVLTGSTGIGRRDITAGGLRLFATTAGVYIGLQQRFEGGQNLSGKTITLSFERYTTVASPNASISLVAKKISDGTTLHTALIALVNFGTNGGFASHSFTFTVPTFSVNQNDVMFELNIGLTNGIASTCDTTFRRIQLEEGSVATPFEQRPYGLELSLCQRYFFTTYSVGTPIGTPTLQGALITKRTWTGGVYGSNISPFAYPVNMRVNPSIVRYSPNNGAVNVVYCSTTGNYNISPIIQPSSKGFVYGTESNVLYDGETMSVHITADAEL